MAVEKRVSYSLPYGRLNAIYKLVNLVPKLSKGNYFYGY